MAYSIKANIGYDPFTFADFARPWTLYKEEHDKQMESVGELEEKASVWENMANEEKDPIAYARYKAYSDKLREVANKMAAGDMDLSVGKGVVSALKSNYNVRMKPTEDAYAARLKDIEAQREDDRKSNGKTIFTKRAQNFSLDEYLDGRRPEYNQANLDDITNDAATGAAALSSRYFGTAEGSAFHGQYNMLTETQGLSPAEALQAMRETGKYPEFDKLISDIRKKYRFTNYQEVEQSLINDAIADGINKGIVYKKTNSLNANRNFIDAATQAQLNQSAYQFGVTTALNREKMKQDDAHFWAAQDAAERARKEATAKDMFTALVSLGLSPTEYTIKADDDGNYNIVDKSGKPVDISSTLEKTGKGKSYMGTDYKGYTNPEDPNSVLLSNGKVTVKVPAKSLTDAEARDIANFQVNSGGQLYWHFASDTTGLWNSLNDYTSGTKRGESVNVAGKRAPDFWRHYQDVETLVSSKKADYMTGEELKKKNKTLYSQLKSYFEGMTGMQNFDFDSANIYVYKRSRTDNDLIVTPQGVKLSKLYSGFQYNKDSKNGHNVGLN